MAEMTMVERVARAIAEKVYTSTGAGVSDDDWRSFTQEAEAAIAAMRAPTIAVICAVEAMAEERYRAAPEMQRWYGDDVWNAGIDAALSEQP